MSIFYFPLSINLISIFLPVTAISLHCVAALYIMESGRVVYPIDGFNRCYLVSFVVKITVATKIARVGFDASTFKIYCKILLRSKRYVAWR